MPYLICFKVLNNAACTILELLYSLLNFLYNQGNMGKKKSKKGGGKKSGHHISSGKKVILLYSE